MAETTNPPLLRITAIEPEPGAFVVQVEGEIDAFTAPELPPALAPGWAAARVVVDLSGVTFLGTAGLAELVHASERAEAVAVPFRLVGGAHCVERAIEVAGLAGRLPLSANLRDALHR